MESFLYKVSQAPIFQNVTYSNSEEAVSCFKGDIEIVQNLETGLVYNRLFNNDLMNYDENYQNEQSISKFFLDHLEQVSEIISKNLGKKSLIEVGCGKGFFLEMLLTKGFEVCGFDKSYGGNNPNIKKTYFDKDSKVNGKGIILRHVLEHVEEPLGFLNKIKDSNGGKGLIYIEVPCFDWILKNRAWFDICYEHVNYFRLSDLRKMFGKVISEGHFFGNGQYIYIVAELESLKDKIEATDKIEFPKDFLENVPNSESGNGSLNVIWGASTKGVIFSLLSRRKDFRIDLAVDINPVKQERYLPVTGIKVVSPEYLMKNYNSEVNIYIMNSNYYDEIIEITKNKYNYIKVDGNN